MQKKKWKKITAFVLAAFMAVTLPNVPHNKYELRAENVNLFTDGDLGDDTSDDLWGESPWSFGSQSWNATNDVNYSEYAANGTASGLGIYYSAEGTVNLYETIASLEAGRYTLSGYVKDANGKGGSVQGYFGSTDNVSETFSITDSFQFFSFYLYHLGGKQQLSRGAACFQSKRCLGVSGYTFADAGGTCSHRIYG